MSCSLLVVDSPESVSDCENVNVKVGDRVEDLEIVALTDSVDDISSDGDADNFETDIVELLLNDGDCVREMD